MLVQRCEQDIWDSVMEQVERLCKSEAGGLPEPGKGLPEEALTQIYQASTFAAFESGKPVNQLCLTISPNRRSFLHYNHLFSLKVMLLLTPL